MIRVLFQVGPRHILFSKSHKYHTGVPNSSQFSGFHLTGQLIPRVSYVSLVAPSCGNQARYMSANKTSPCLGLWRCTLRPTFELKPGRAHYSYSNLARLRAPSPDVPTSSDGPAPLLQYDHLSSEVCCNWLTPPFFPSRTGVWPLPAHINPREERRRRSKPPKAKSFLRSSLPPPLPPAPAPALLNPLYTKCVSIQPLFHTHLAVDDLLVRCTDTDSGLIVRDNPTSVGEYIGEYIAKRCVRQVYRLRLRKTSFDPRNLPR